MSAALKEPLSDGRNPALILTISNGAAHTRAALAVARAIDAERAGASAVVVDISDYMSWFAKLTHVTLYLWLLKSFPSVWGLIDGYQKRQDHTSPDWYYRRGCRRLFDLARDMQPGALIATEVGCCEVAALIKRELKLDIPLVAVDIDHDADRAWIQPGVDLYCVTSNDVRTQMVAHGALTEQVRIWGVPLDSGFHSSRDRKHDRTAVCLELKLDPSLPLILVAGGGEGLGKIEETVSHLLRVSSPGPQVIAMTGKNVALRRRCEEMARQPDGKRLRVLGWTDHVANLMRAADLLISKTGIVFDEAIAAELPIIALEPLPGSERVKYRLLDDWGVGRAARTLDEMRDIVLHLLNRPSDLNAMREKCKRRRTPDAATEIARWLEDDSRQPVFAYKAANDGVVTRDHAGAVTD